MSRTAQSAKRRVMVWKAGVLRPVGRTVVFSNNCRAVYETSAKGSFTEIWSFINLSGSKRCGALCARPPCFFVVRCWSQDQFLCTSTDRLVFPSRRQVVGGTRRSRGAVLKARQSATKTWPPVSAGTSQKIHGWSNGYRSNCSNGRLIWFR